MKAGDEGRKAEGSTAHRVHAARGAHFKEKTH